MTKTENQAIIKVTFYHSSGETPPECLTKKYVLKHWQNETDLRHRLDKVVEELNYISGYGIKEVKVEAESIRFQIDYADQCRPFQKGTANPKQISLMGFQKILRFQVGNYKGRGGSVKLDIPRLLDGIVNNREPFKPSNNLLQIRLTPATNSKKNKRKGIDFLLSFDRENPRLLSFLNQISKDGNLAPFTTKDWQPYPKTVLTTGQIILCRLPQTQTSFHKNKKIGDKEKKRLKAEEKARLKREKLGIAYKDQKNTKKADQVYLIQMCGNHLTNDMYKIGISNAPGKRLQTLNTASPFDLKIIHRFVAEPAEEAEKQLHSQYSDVRMNGEWFELTPQQVSDLKTITGFENGKFKKG